MSRLFRRLPAGTNRGSSLPEAANLFCSRGILVVILVLFCVPQKGLATQTILHDQVLATDTTWSGNLLLDGVIVVGRQTTLTIQPGTTIRFQHRDRNRDGIGDGELRVLGRLLSRGTARRPILFTSAASQPKAGDWSYVLLFTASGANAISHTDFQYAFSGLQVHFSTARVEHCRFQHNREGLRFGRAHLQIQKNIFTDNEIGIRFTRMEGPAAIVGNRITNNRIGIFLVPSGQNIVDFFIPDRGHRIWNTGRLTITGNDIYNNFWYNLDLGEKQLWDLTVPDNYWGSTDPKAITATLFDQHRDPSLGKVLFTPVAKKPLTTTLPPRHPSGQ